MAAGGSASIEFLETAVIAYAVARSGYYREAIFGSIAGIAIVALIASFFGVGLQLVPLHWLQIVIGAVLIWFGWGWVKKSVQRQAQGKRASWMADNPLTTEGIALETQQGFSKLNFLVMTKSAALEAFEVAVVVITLGLASGAWYEALGATLLSLVLSVGLVGILHRYLLRVPEVLIKLGAGILLCTLGTFWLGEGSGLEWWFGELAIVGIALLYGLIAFFAVYWLRNKLTAETQVDPSIQ